MIDNRPQGVREPITERPRPRPTTSTTTVKPSRESASGNSTTTGSPIQKYSVSKCRTGLRAITHTAVLAERSNIFESIQQRSSWFSKFRLEFCSLWSQRQQADRRGRGRQRGALVLGCKSTRGKVETGLLITNADVGIDFSRSRRRTLGKRAFKILSWKFKVVHCETHLHSFSMNML